MSLCCGMAVVGTAYSACESREMRRVLDVRRLRITEPLVTSWTAGGYSTTITTPRIESERSDDWAKRHWDAVKIALYYEPDFLAGALNRGADSQDDMGK